MKHYRVLWSRQAIIDLHEIVKYISQDSPQSAQSVFKRLKDCASKLKKQPERCRTIPELGEIGIVEFREAICTPYRIMYRVNGQSVHVLAVLDGRRDAESLLFAKLVHISKD